MRPGHRVPPYFLLFLVVAVALAGPLYGASQPPVDFEPNLGQASAPVHFLSRSSSHVLYLTESEATLALVPQAAGGDARWLRMRLVGARDRVALGAEEPLPARTNYLIGKNPADWLVDVPRFGKVRYREVYPGVDVVFYGSEGEIEHDFVVSPGSPVESIRFVLEGADAISLDESGDLRLSIGDAELIQRAPVLYQTVGGTKVPVRGEYRLFADGTIGFHVPRYDDSRPLVIDPVLSYSTYLGRVNGFLADHDVAVDREGYTYVTGSTDAVDFPTRYPLAGKLAGGIDAFVAKLNPTGTAFVYSTYIGGSGDDIGRGIALEPSGAVAITGETTSPDFPTKNPIQATNRGGSDAFVLKLNASGNGLVFSTYLGGGSDESAHGIAVSAAGYVTIAGRTTSANFPARNAVQKTLKGGIDAFVAKYNSTGSVLIYATFLGGSGDENPDRLPLGVATDAAENAYVVGTTLSSDFPVVNALQSQHAGGGRDAFIVKLNPVGSKILFSTYLGGQGGDSARDVAVDAVPNIYFVGASRSLDYPIKNAVQSKHAGGQLTVPPVADNYDAVITKLAGTGQTILYSTFWGGSATDALDAVAVDVTGSVHAVGSTLSTDFPLVNPLQGINRGGTDAVLVRLDPAGTGVLYSTYLGGSNLDNPPEEYPGVSVDSRGNAYISGTTRSTDFPLDSPLQPRPASNFLVRLEGSPEVTLTLSNESAQTMLRVSVANGSTAAERVELKIWAAKGDAGEEPTFNGLTTTFTMPASMALIQIYALPLSWSDGLSLGATLLDPRTGEILSRSFCDAVPCNLPGGP